MASSAVLAASHSTKIVDHRQIARC
jgi:hypothetical protein